jgi:hypothetical protein
VFAVGSALAGIGATALMGYDYGADLVGQYRWYGLICFALATVFGFGYLVALLTLSRLVWPAGSTARSIATALATAAGTLFLLAAGIPLALTSGGATDLVLTGASAEVQAAALQVPWIIVHAAYYGVTAIVLVWLVAFALAARRTGVVRTLGAVLLVAGLAILLVAPYPTTLAFVSLAFLILGIVLLVRSRRERATR